MLLSLASHFSKKDVKFSLFKLMYFLSSSGSLQLILIRFIQTIAMEWFQE